MIDSLFISIISNFIVLISVLLLWRQIREMRRQIQSSTYQTIVQMFDNFSRIMLENPNLVQSIFGTDQTIDQIKSEWSIFMRFDWFESIVIQRYKYHAIPKDVYDHWMRLLEYELSVPFIRDVWMKYGNLYYPLLQQEVQQILMSQQKITETTSLSLPRTND